MKIIVDTNVVVSAVLKGRKPRELIQFIVDSCECEWIVSQDILSEYKSVLRRPKFRLSEDILREWFDIFDWSTSLISVDLSIDFPRDRKDAIFLACASVSQADFLITGDRDFEEIENFNGTRILSISQFKTFVMTQ